MAEQSVSRTAIVTGGASGISLCVVKLLLKEGYRISILDLSEGDLSNEISTADKSRVLFLSCDVSNWATVRKAFEDTREAFGQINVVVNGAGVYEPKWSSFWEATETETYKTVDINLSGSIYITRLAIRDFIRSRLAGATVVNLSSVAGQRASFYCPLYTASKWGISGFTRAMGTLEDQLGIRVVAIAPGIVKTPLWTRNAEKISMLSEMDEWVTPEEVAEAILDVIKGAHEYRGGDVIEVLKNRRRLVPLAELPSGPGSTASNSSAVCASIVEQLVREGESQGGRAML
ncbi:NAD(P)-binding protein [Rhizodiscina lignyota]|uniref:NAD(P)-binding protein n=1 Tax=Rhizodiscina lignyota TaxID=1504668 RepID=A0A9P4I3I4_9PEZI|nr:NAD(P)-binding protein [Rhizodiscina lignyota]